MPTTNSLGNYNEIFFAQEALIQLEKQLGMASRVHRGYDPNPAARGDTIRIRRPGTFTAQDAPSTAQNLVTDQVSVQLNNWKEVKMSLTDKELTLSADQLIQDHIRPAMVAIADNIDIALNTLALSVPWYTQHTASFVLDDIGAVRKLMRDNKVPLGDTMNFEVGSDIEQAILGKLAASGMMPGQQDQALRQGTLGNIYGFDIFPNQNTPLYTSGVSADAVGAITGGPFNVVAGATTSTINFNAVTIGGTFLKGDIVKIAGDAQQYVLTAPVTADGAGLVTGAIISPALKQTANNAAVVTVVLLGASKTQHLAFHRNAFALAMAPLSTFGADVGGARMAVAHDPKTQLALRSRIFYVGNESALYVAFDVLYGFVCLDPNLAVRMSTP